MRVDSSGGGGSVDQSNSVDSDATALNLNALFQDADQDQAAGGTQAVGQSADSEQDAAAASKAEQAGAKNTNISVRVQSPGDDGDVVGHKLAEGPHVADPHRHPVGEVFRSERATSSANHFFGEVDRDELDVARPIPRERRQAIRRERRRTGNWRATR